MPTPSVSILGLPSSGKTTYLAALWHVLTDSSGETALKLKNLLSGNIEHLNEIATRWRDAQEQKRTEIGGSRVVSINMTDKQGSAVTVSFPDVPGEAYRRMWEDRDVDDDVVRLLQCSGVMLFIHADTIKPPRWIIDDIAVAEAMDGGAVELEDETAPGAAPTEDPAAEGVEWHARHSPTHVQLVDLLQLLRRRPLDMGPRRIAIMFSAWDKAEGDELTPAQYLQYKLPLLYQYLTFGPDAWDLEVYGISAQGGEYDSEEFGAKPKGEAAELRKLDDPSDRIKLVGPEGAFTDVTQPISWLME